MMTTINVQFSDGGETTIVSYFSGPPDSAFWSNVGVVDASDPRWKTYYTAQMQIFPPPPGLPTPTGS